MGSYPKDLLATALSYMGPMALIFCLFSVFFAEVQISEEAKKELTKYQYSFVLHGGYEAANSPQSSFGQRKYILVSINPVSSVTLTGTTKNNQEPTFEISKGGLAPFLVLFLVGVGLTWWLWSRL